MSAELAVGTGSAAAPGHTLPPGTKLRDFRIDRVLGEGGFGIVYLAFDPALERRVALKEYLPSSMASRAGDGHTVVVKSEAHSETFEIGRKSFINEARLLTRFDHPAVVKVLQFWEEHGTAYMVMPYYEGPTLKRVLADLGRAPTEAEVLAWLLPLLDALEVLHAQNCYHRDIAPDNILLTANGPLLLDFGAARRVIGDLTHALTAMLKPGYAPIEQYGEMPGMEQGPWTDIYALASVLYGALGRVRPPPSVERLVADRMQPLVQIAAGRARAPFLAAVDRALAVRPEQRPQDVAAFRALLLADAMPAPAATVLSPGTALPATRVVGSAGGDPWAGAGATTTTGPPPTTGFTTTPPRGTLRHNLPPQRSSFVGRESELAQIKSLLEPSPLVTVLGMGGLGKTRLALQAAADLLPQFADGAWFIDLSAVTDPALVVGEAARAFQIADEPGRPLLQTVCAWLKTRQLLLVLDNCEHVVAAAAELVDAILGTAPQVKVLATSRELLDVPGEHSYPILPLPLPARDATLEVLQQSAAVRMFADRARAQQPSFALEDEEPKMLADLLVRLEGIPLAIELAAARLRTLSIPEILVGLDDRYQFLAGGSRLLQKRQQTLRALVDWSYDMLEGDEQRLFARLAVFAGGFDAGAAKAVCADDEGAGAAGGGAVPAARVADLLASLVQKSLVARESSGSAKAGAAKSVSRYRLLETLRDYAREKLEEQDAGGSFAARHCAHYFALAKEAGRGMHGAEQGRWARRLEDELENLRAAAACALAGGTDPLIAVKLAVALTGFWILRGHPSEGRKLVNAALALPQVQGSDLAKAWALYTSATLAGAQGDHVTATSQFETCLALRRGLGNPVEIAATLSTLSLARLQAGDPEGAAECETEALQLFAKAEDRLGQAISWLHLGQIHLWAGGADTALVDNGRALATAREIGNREVEAESELTAAEAHLMRGELAPAREAVGRSLQVCKEAGDRRGEASATWWLGRLALEADEPAAARAPLQQALRAFLKHEMRAQMLGCLDDLALLMKAEGSPASALELAAAADHARQRFVLRRSPRDEQRWRSRLTQMRSELDEAAARAAEESGRSWEIGQAVRAALDSAA